MKKQNKKVYKYSYLNIFLKFVLLFLFTFLISFLITNWRVLILPSSQRVLQELDFSGEDLVFEGFTLKDGKLIMTADDASIRINTNNNYIEKFKYNYVIQNNIDVEVQLTEIDSYGSPFENTFIDRLLTDIDLSAFSIRNNVNSIELKFKSGELVITKLCIDNRIKFNPYIFIAVFITGIILFISLFYKEKLLMKVENIFLLVALTTGILFIFLLPNRLGLSWDDQIHFLNVYGLSQGQTFKWTESSLHLVDKVVSNNFTFFDTPEERFESNQYLNAHHDYSNIINSHKNNISLGSKEIAYLPMVLGFKIPDILGLPFTFSLLISRLANLLVYIIVTYLAIKNIPICKRLLAFIALLPGPMFLAAQFSYDPPITAFYFLGISMIVKMIINKEPIMPKDLVFFALSIAIASLPKGVYLLLILLPIMISTNKYKGKISKKKTELFLISVLILVAFLFISPYILGSAPSGDPRGGDTSILRQLLLIKDHPFPFLKIFFNNISKSFLYKFVGVETITHFAYVGIIPPSSNLYILSLCLLSFFTFTDTYGQDEKNHISLKFKSVFFVIIIGITCLIWTSLYLDFTPVGSTVINGVQGRYFIPLLPLFLIMLNSYKIKNEIPERNYNFILLISSTTILLGSIFTTILSHYCL